MMNFNPTAASYAADLKKNPVTEVTVNESLSATADSLENDIYPL